MGGGKGGGGGGGQTQQSSQYTNLTPWAQPYVTSILGAAQQQVFNTGKDESGNPTIEGIRPFNAYGSFNEQGGQYGLNPSAQAAANAAVAGFQPLQNQAYQGASNLSQSMAPGITGGAALGSLYAGQNLANQSTDPNAVGAYMNPYIQNALNPSLQLLNQQYGIAGQNQQAQATKAGAFGGSRASLENSLNQQNQMLAQNQLVGNAYNQAYGNAQQQMNAVANLGLQGYGQAGSLAGQQLAQQQGILGLQNQFGGQQQQQQQNIINAGMANYQQAQQYPMQQLGQLKGLLTGIPITDVTTTQTQAQPSAVSQLAGLGTAGVAGLALANKAAEGGLMKSYAAGGAVRFDGGGIANLNRKALLNPTSISPQQLKRSTQNGAIAPQVSGIAQAIQLNEKVHGDSAAASAKGMPQGTIIDELRAQAAQKDEQEAMAEAIPKAIEVLKQKMEVALQAGDTESVQRYAQEIQQLVAMVQQPQQEQAPSAPAPAGIEQLAATGGQPPEQGIEAAQSNLPTQTMAEGGIISYARGGSAQVLADADEEERLAAEEAELYQMYGSGSENDFVQSIMPAAKQSGTAHPSAAVSVKFEPKAQSSEFTATRKGSHKYENEIISAAEKIGLPKEIAIHAAFKETGNLKNPETARSRAGAIGVMQLMPGTAKELGVDPYNPQENIMGGVTYLKKLYDKYQDPQLTLMAYNAGPGRLDRALKSEKGIASLPSETLAYRMAQGGIAHYAGEDESLVEADPAEVRRAYIEAAEMEAGLRPRHRLSQADVREAEDRIAYRDNLPNRVSQADLREVEDRIAYRDNLPNRVSQASVREGDERIFNAMRPNPASQADVRASDNRILAADVKPTPIPVPVKPIDTEERDRERARANATANVNKDYAQTLYPIETTSKPDQKENKPRELTGLEALQAEILQDIRARREEAKKTRESNNLMALMQAGFATAASKNIHPLGAIAEGGQQGIGTLAALRKQEAEEAKDIGAQQIGLYRFGSTAEQAKALQELRATQNDLRKGPEERARDMAAATYDKEVASIDRRQLEYEKQYGLDPAIQEQFDLQRRALRKQIYEHFKVPTITEFKLPPIVPPKPKQEPGLWDRITGKDKQGTPPPPAGYQVQ
jgi:soluble lytic murein transglycosylase-like protein